MEYVVLFKVYDIDRDGFISNGELFLVLKMASYIHLSHVSTDELISYAHMS